MQRVPVFFIVALVIVALYYFTPLRDYMQGQFGPSSAPVPQKEQSAEEAAFDKASLDLLVASNKVANLEGKLSILQIAKDHPDWLTQEEYEHLSVVAANAEDELQKAKDKYERVKEQYARETAIKIVKESLATQAGGEEKAESD